MTETEILSVLKHVISTDYYGYKAKIENQKEVYNEVIDILNKKGLPELLEDIKYFDDKIQLLNYELNNKYENYYAEIGEYLNTKLSECNGKSNLYIKL